MYDKLDQYHTEKNDFGKLNIDDFVDWLGGKEVFAGMMLESYGLCLLGRAPFAPELSLPQGPQMLFNSPCKGAIESPSHIHIDRHGNYITGFCAGLTIGDARDLKKLYEGVEVKPILALLYNKGVLGLLNFAVKEYGFQQRETYSHPCHLCTDIRKHIADSTDEFSELAPKGFYEHLHI
jgi:hypothetical protein